MTTTARYGAASVQPPGVGSRESVPQAGRNREERVKPPPRLVHALGDEVGGVVAGGELLVLEREVPLREGHRPGVEPGVDHLGHAAHRPPPARRRPRVLVDERLVRVEVRRQRLPDLGGELRVAANDLDLRRVGVIDPHRERAPPVPVARDRPVDVVLEPLAEAPLAYLGRVPVHPGVARQHVVPIGRGAHEPGRAGVLEERRAASPAVRIRVRLGLRLPEQIAALQLLDDERVGRLHEHSAHDGDARVELAAPVHRLNEGEPVALAGGVVVRAERRRHVHDPRAVGGLYKVLAHHQLVLAPGERHPVQRPPVARAYEVAAPETLDHVPPALPIGPEECGRALLGDDHRPVGGGLLAKLQVFERRIDGERGVRRERPGRCRPDEDASARDALVAVSPPLPARPRRAPVTHQVDRHVDARVLDVLVP